MKSLSIKIALIAIIFASNGVLMYGEASMGEKVLFDFRDDPTDFRWYALNDTVMGGQSRSGLVMGEGDTVVFYGDVSLRNNGGFASIRSDAFRFGMDEYDGIRVRVKGDGKTYKLRLQTDPRYSRYSYEYAFETIDGEWMDIDLEFSDFVMVYFGRVIQDAPQVSPEDVSTIGFMISDKQEGYFLLEIDKISAYRGTPFETGRSRI